MCNLLRKELRLAAHPSLYMFMAMGALVLIPAYPYGVVFFFGGLGVFQTVMFGRETRDVFYTALLPVRKGDGVRGKILLAVFSQLTQLALSLPFAFLRTLYMAEGNPAGIESLFKISPRMSWRRIFRPDFVKNPCHPSGCLRIFALQGKKSTHQSIHVEILNRL